MKKLNTSRLLKTNFENKVIYIQNKALESISSVGMLFLANSLCIKMYTIQIISIELLVLAKKGKPKVAPILEEIRKASKINPWAATQGLYLSSKPVKTKTT